MTAECSLLNLTFDYALRTAGVRLIYGSPGSYKTRLALALLCRGARLLGLRPIYMATGKHLCVRALLRSIKVYRVYSAIDELKRTILLERLCRDADRPIAVCVDSIAANHVRTRALIRIRSAFSLLLTELFLLKRLADEYEARVLLVDYERRDGKPLLMRFYKEVVDRVFRLKITNETLSVEVATPQLSVIASEDYPIAEVEGCLSEEVKRCYAEQSSNSS